MTERYIPVRLPNLDALSVSQRIEGDSIVYTLSAPLVDAQAMWDDLRGWGICIRTSDGKRIDPKDFYVQPEGTSPR